MGIDLMARKLIKPYKIHKSKYIPTSGKYPCSSAVPNKNIAGMTYTASRSGHPFNEKRSDMRFKYDSMLNNKKFINTKSCSCCGTIGAGKKILSIAGKKRLEILREKYVENL